MIRLPFVLLLALTQSAVGIVGPLPPQTAAAGVEVQLRAAGNQTTFQLSELVPLEVAFRATRPSTYSIEIADGWNHAPATDRFLVEPTGAIIDRHVWWVHGTTCCDSRRAFLTPTPAVYRHELTDFIRFTEPGEYRVQYTTRRVFKAPPTREFEPSELLLRSNVLTIRITEDDPKWVEEALRQALAAVYATPPPVLRVAPSLPLRGSLELPAASAAASRYRQGVRQLRQLDTPVAIRERVARIRMPSVAQWRAREAKGNGYDGVESWVANSSRPDLVAAALHERAAASDFAVMRGYFELWVNVLLERDHPTLVRLARPKDARQGGSVPELRGAATEQLLDIVRELHRSKTGVAAEVTAATVRHVEADRRVLR